MSFVYYGGRSEIRTHEPREGLPVFKTGAFNHSAILPGLGLKELLKKDKRFKSFIGPCCAESRYPFYPFYIDNFKESGYKNSSNLTPRSGLMMDHKLSWIGFGIIVLIIMALDLGVFQKKGRGMSMREATLKVFLFISLALGFNAFLWMREGPVAGMEFLAGYLIELSLSVDNLFVFLMLFSYFKVPAPYQNRVLFWGIFGALVLRAVFIYIGAALLSKFHWVMYVFGAFLVFTAIKMALQKDDDVDPEQNPFVKLLKKIMPISKEFHGEKFFIKQGAKYVATPLFVVLVLVETTDVIFAFDSIPAIFAVTKDPFIVFTSNVFAILGLRALFFCISGLMDKFAYLKQALSFILAFVGIKMLIVDIYKIPITVSLVVIVSALLIAIITSIYRVKRDEKEKLGKAE